METSMEKIVEYLNNPVHVSATAAALSALCALLTFLFFLLSRRISRQEMVDILKLEILQVVSTVQGREAWITTVNISQKYEGGGVGPQINRLAGLLGVIYSDNSNAPFYSRLKAKLKSKLKLKNKYEKDKWMALLPIALEELKKEGYKDLLGM